jgi:hypothetical protein
MDESNQPHVIKVQAVHSGKAFLACCQCRWQKTNNEHQLDEIFTSKMISRRLLTEAASFDVFHEQFNRLTNLNF